MSTPTRFPLSWPTGWKRTSPGLRTRAAFSKRVHRPGDAYARKEALTIGDGLQRLDGELRRLRAANVVVSSNLYLNQDGSISARQGKMLQDPGVAVYFKLGKADRVLACENMAAIAGHIEAIRAQDRYGVGTVEQAFAGYTALPAKDETWRSALGFGPADVITAFAIDFAFRERTRRAHPDTGGSHEAMAALNAARDAARAFLEAQP